MLDDVELDAISAFVCCLDHHGKLSPMPGWLPAAARSSPLAEELSLGWLCLLPKEVILTVAHM